MPDTQSKQKSGFSIDWIVKGTLTKVGDIFDRLTGRGWKPSSSIATSEIVERLKSLLDSEVKENGDKRKYVPHNIKLKMQWDKFSTDSEKALTKLEHEMLIAAVDHINDKHYFTYAPLSIEVKPDYFTSGVVLLAGFEKFEADEREGAVNVTLPGAKVDDILPEAIVEKANERVIVRFEAGGKPVQKELYLEEGKRLSVGRTKENDLPIDDVSVSKAHASLLLNKEGKLIVADTGSTNGTFIRGERIAYGKAFEVIRNGDVIFGLINVSFEFMPKPVVAKERPKTEAYKVGEFEFQTRPASELGAAPKPDVTEAAIPPPAVRVDANGTKDVPAQPALTDAGIKLDSDSEEKDRTTS
jgi:hypothetical protein